MIKKNQDDNFIDNKLTNLDSIMVKKDPNTDNELWFKKYIDDELTRNTILRFNQTH